MARSIRPRMGAERPDGAAALFSEDALYFETPFSAPHEGRGGIGAYWAEVTSTQSNVRFTSKVLHAEGDVALSHWQSRYPRDDRVVQLDGIFVLRFKDDLHCLELREWWHAER